MTEYADWVDLQTAASLEGEAYHTIQMRYMRGNYEYVRKEQDLNGGKDRVYIAVKSLSERAQANYKRRQRREINRKWLEDEGAFQEDYPLPWYYGIDLAWYTYNYHQEYLEKCAMSAEIERYLDDVGEHIGRRTEWTEQFAREHLGISGKQFKRYLARYREGVKYGVLAQEETGQNYSMYKVLALCTPPKKGQHKKLTEVHMADIENLWATEKFHTNLQSLQMLYEDFCDKQKARGAEYIPSFQTVRRYVDVIQKKNSNVKTLLQYGVAGFKHDVMQKRKRDMKRLQVMEVIQGDAHTFDCWVQWTQPNGKVTAIRPYLVAFIDMRSRCIVGWGICVQPNAEIIKQVLIHMMYPKKDSPIEGVPKVVYIDNGKDFTAETLTGRKRSERFDIDHEIKGFYKSVGIEYDKRALPYQAWTKAQIERFFRTLIERFTKRFDSYTGTLTGSKTAGKVKKDIKGMLERGELYTLEEFSAMFEHYINEMYHKHLHGGLKDQKEPNPTPIAVYSDAPHYRKAPPPLEYVLSLLGKTAERTVYNVGIELGGQTYTHENLAAHIGEKVLVRYHDEDMSYITVYDGEGRQICTAYACEGLNPIAEQDDAQLHTHIRAQNRQLRRARTDIAAYQVPYEDRVQLPEMSAAAPKTVALPQDRQFMQQAAEDTKKDTEVKTVEFTPASDEFIRRQADKAFHRIEKGA